MKEEILKYKHSAIAWHRFGTGPNPVICFHGYGEDGTGFSFLPEYTGQEYSFYAIDLPFHGKTDWQEGLLFTHQDLVGIINLIIGSGKQKLKVIGFSLGGRIALSLYQSIPSRIDKLVLLAPDGLKVNFWYWLAARTAIGNRFFSFTMKHPGWFFGFLKLLDKFRFVNKSIFKFVNYYVGDAAVRNALYTRWTSLRKLKPNLEKIKSFIRQHQTPARLVYGKHDRIILSSVGEKFKKGIEPWCTLTVIEAGHQVLHEKHASEIARALQH